MKKGKIAGKIAAIICAGALALACFGCSSSSTPETVENPINIVALNGPTGIGMANLSESTGKYNVQFVSQPDQVVSAISNGSVDIAAVPTNLASVLYNKTQGGVKVISLDSEGSLYILDTTGTVSSIADLKGKTIYATGQGANPQYVLEYLLQQAGMTPGQDVTINYLAQHSELASMVASGEAQIAMLPEPFVSVAETQNSNAKVAINLNDAWKQTTGNDMALGCVIVRTDYLEANGDMVDMFLKDLKTSVDAANNDVDATAQLCVDKGILPNLNVAKAAIPRCSVVDITGDDMVEPINAFLNVLYSSNPKAVGGTVPAEDGFYFKG